MPHIVACTAIYKGVLPFVADYGAAISRAITRCSEPVEILVALDGLGMPDELLRALSPGIRLTCVEASNLSPARVRSHLLHAAGKLSPDVLVFTDADDMLEPDAFSQHLAALENADFSFSDQIPVDRDGHITGPTFFMGRDVPAEISGPEVLLDRNFVGFTASAVRHNCLTETARNIPGSVGAADWWFFSMLLLAGNKGQRTEKPVVRYRLHGANILGPKPDPSLASFRRRCVLAQNHYAALPQNDATHSRLRAVNQLIEALDATPDAWQDRIAAACAKPGVWFEDVWRLASLFSLANNR